MADLKGTNVSSPIMPFTDQDTFPTHDSKYGKGGHKEVATYEEMVAIPAARLTIGTVCYVQNSGTEYRYIGSGNWEEIASDIVVSDTEPTGQNDGKIWFDTGDTGNIDTRNDEKLNSVNRSIAKLQEQMERVLSILDYGVVAGDSTVSWRNAQVNAAEQPINPNEEDDDDDESTIKPITDGLTYTVPNISIKMDTAANFSANYQNLINGELIWITDYEALYIFIDGLFKQVATSGGSGGGDDVKPDDTMTSREIQTLIENEVSFNSLGFIDLYSKKYKARVNEEGNLIIYDATERPSPGEVDASERGGNYITHFLNINSVFCGGDNTETSFISCSHNFVELSNASTEDINLNGLYLLYTPKTPLKWQALPLVGTIKAGSTFLIRGAQCSAKTNTTVINVDDYDMLWYEGNDDQGKITTKNLIKFDQAGPTFYLCWGTRDSNNNIMIYNSSNSLKKVSEWVETAPYNTSIIRGYVDSVGLQDGSGEGSAPCKISGNSSMNDCLFFRWFTLDPTNQAYKAYSGRKSSAVWTYIDLQAEGDNSNVMKKYFDRERKVKYTPKASKDNKTIFNTYTTFDTEKPNYVNCTFGRQATYVDGSVKKTATRCFNWISVGYYNEYLEYRKGNSGDWTRVYSITEASIETGGQFASNAAVRKYINQYKRIRWITTNQTAVTTHKVLVFGLTNGDYQYRVGRDGDSDYTSETFTFHVWADSEVTSFNFCQVTDQQGFNWMEYLAWEKSAKLIADRNNNIKFTINTGDITQNGNRENEWLDYWEGRKHLAGKEEMFTIGNNDLCGVQGNMLGDGTASVYKISHLNVIYYYTFELDENNSPIFEYRNGISPTYNSSNTTDKIEEFVTENSAGGNYIGFKYYMPSLYSFNFGAYHFVSLNSEYKEQTSAIYTSATTTGFLGQVLTQLEEWLRKDLLIWQGNSNYNNTAIQPTGCNKAIIYMHEMPFTIITLSTYEANADRGGSKLNNTNSNGSNYRFSRLFKHYGIRLVMGGHKHTYCISRPIYDAPEGYITNNSVTSGASLIKFGSESANDVVNNVNCNKPVIQVLQSELPSSEDHARYEVVSKITAPVYVMSQATGYKLVSNQELPSSKNIPWLQKYFPCRNNQSTSNKDAENFGQHYPTYVRYELSASGITIKSYQIKGIWNTNESTNKASYYWNNWKVGMADEALPTLSQDIIQGSDVSISF